MVTNSSLKLYWSYLKKTILWLNQLAEKEHLSLIWVYCDYFRAVIQHRCLIRQYVIGEFWKLSNPERKKRLTYSRMVKLFDKCNNKQFIHYLNEKPEFNTYFKDFIHRDWLYINKATEGQFINFIKRHNTIIVKPADGVEGGGIHMYSLSEHLDSDLPHLFKKFRSENVLIEQVITQHHLMVFGNTSVNTIRIHTVTDSCRKAHVVKAILRAGVGDSVVDNYCQGGSIYEVDIQTGLVCTYGQSKNNSKSYVHPGTDIVMLGYKIPNWNLALEGCIKAAELLPQIRIIGWDVAITENGIELIEGNHNPDYELFEFLGSTGYYQTINELI